MPVAIKSAELAARLRGRFKIPLTKGISSYWYQRRRFGYNSLVTFGSRWTPRTRSIHRGGAPGGQADEQMRTIGNRTSEHGPIILASPAVLCFFLHPRGTGCSAYLSVPGNVLPRFHVKLLRIRGEVCISPKNTSCVARI